jgi:proline iminopeptidase
MRHLLRTLAAATIAAACTRAAPPSVASAPTTARDSLIAVPGGRVFYRVLGTGDGVAVIGIHGGPGGQSCRMSPLGRLGAERRVVLYDQLGTGRSDRPTDTTLWRLPRFVQEIDSIRARLGLREVVLAGFSWGGTVALEYALERPNSGVRALVLGSPLLSTPRWMADADTLVAALPAVARDAILAADRRGDYDTPPFRAAMDSFAVRHLARRPAPPAPECTGVTGNQAIYRYMWGPSEFRATGTLRTYDREARLGELRLPVLLVTGEHDEARPSTMRDFQRRIAGAELVVVPGAGHGLLRDAPVEVTDAIRDFLARRVR